LALAEEYEARRITLTPVLEEILEYVRDEIGSDAMVDAVQGRIKDAPSFMAKSAKILNGNPRYLQPLSDITDQIAIRIVVKFDAECARIETRLRQLFNPVEKEAKQPEHDDQFGYEATHLLLFIPEDIVLSKKLPIAFLEAQVCTLFQHAWAEANHDVGYKPGVKLNRYQGRLKAFAAASAWAADRAFSELREALESDTD
jgi:putative GTP pyrophosphokinase